MLNFWSHSSKSTLFLDFFLLPQKHQLVVLGPKLLLLISFIIKRTFSKDLLMNLQRTGFLKVLDPNIVENTRLEGLFG